ncbi:MAG: hypothetical protein RLZZ241_683 [Bacteroidota bacterium]|jgi:membrane associated rhomboid family serine protease
MHIHPVTLLIIVANVLFSMRGFNDNGFFNKYSFNVGAIQSGQPIRMFTSGFLHVDVAHLVLNLFTFYFFAPVVIAGFGPFQLLFIYIITLAAGSMFALYFHRRETYYTAVGASGAVTGILYVAILLQPEMRLALMFIPIPLPAYVLGIAYLFYSIYGMKSRMGNIGHSAHFGGAIGGYVITLILKPEILLMHTDIVLLMAAPILLLFWLKKHKRI